MSTKERYEDVVITADQVESWGACYSFMEDYDRPLREILDLRYPVRYLDGEEDNGNERWSPILIEDRVWVGVKWFSEQDREGMIRWLCKAALTIPGRAPIPGWDRWAEGVVSGEPAEEWAWTAAVEAAWEALKGERGGWPARLAVVAARGATGSAASEAAGILGYQDIPEPEKRRWLRLLREACRNACLEVKS